MLYVGHSQAKGGNGIAAFDTQNSGAFLWKQKLTTGKPFFDAPAIAGTGEIYAVANGTFGTNQVYKITTDAGGLPSYTIALTAGANISSPVVIDAGGQVYIGDEAGTLYILPDQSEVIGTGAGIAHIAMRGGALYVITTDGVLYSLD